MRKTTLPQTAKISETVLGEKSGQWCRERAEQITGGGSQTFVAAGTSESLLKKLGRETEEVNRDVLNALGENSRSSAAAPHLSAEQIRKIQRKTAAVPKKNMRIARDQYLFWLLWQLKRDWLLTFSLPAQIDTRPNRASAFDAASDKLPPASVFRRWQSVIASRSINVKTDDCVMKSGGESYEAEFRVIAALLAFGSWCGRDALQILSQITADDYQPEENILRLKNRAGQPFFLLTLHPVQALSLFIYTRAEKKQGNGDETKTQPTRKLFPSLSGGQGRRAFTKWLIEILSAETKNDGQKQIDKDNPDAPAHFPPALSALLAGVRRWMLEIYPVYLVSILAGSFDAPVQATRTTVQDEKDKKRRPLPDISPAEKNLRRRLRRSLLYYLSNQSGSFSQQNCRNVYEEWNLLLKENRCLPELIKADEKTYGERFTARKWNLYLLCRVIEQRLKNYETSAFNTAAGWFESGCRLLDTLGSQTVWQTAAARLSATNEIIESEPLESDYNYTEMLAAAVELDLASADLISQTLPRRLAKKPTKGKRTPLIEEIRVIAEYLELAAARSRKVGTLSPQIVLLYFDLLTFGLRKSEALVVAARDVDSSGGDLIINSGKTPAARRAIPLEECVFTDAARRVSAVAERLKNDNRPDVELLSALTDKNFYRTHRPAPDKAQRRKLNERFFSVKTLDNALAEAVQECGLPFSPHSFRHASISRFLENRAMPTEIIAKIHGHADLEKTFSKNFAVKKKKILCLIITVFETCYFLIRII